MTSYLLDTNAISEAPKKSPDIGFMEWFINTNEANLFTSCLVLGEIKKGINLNNDAARRATFSKWLDEVIDEFADRIVEVNNTVASLWGELMASGQLAGKTPPIIDALLAAQCLTHKLTLVTRNVRDFEQFTGLQVFCPWSAKVG
ncbi:MAG TPA: type II toxin-antitoxin system VapC family toxin [Candidatus Saccharimonadales bacterium]|nr:type II toxin-antitoxin system VapC family toxin [Candidatus Saccharimonadales bacterium]